MFTSLWNCNRTIQEMLVARGYSDQLDLDDNDEDRIDEKEMVATEKNFETTLKKLCGDTNNLTQAVLDRLTYLRQHTFTGEWIYVFFVMQKIGKNLISSYVKSMDEAGVSRAILVSVPLDEKGGLDDQSVLTPFALKDIAKHSTDKKIIEHFYTHELTVNLLNHETQPKSMKILTPDEIADVKKLLHCSVDAPPPFARINPEDPSAKFLGLQIGDMIECTCHSPTVGETVRYRVCMY